MKTSVIKAIFSDSHFWVPMVVLIVGLLLLLWLH
ncbi:MAG: translocated intimin receptor Tir [Acidobacteria bacterium]|nr:translocated intimin receptor Tir [Acidobacteriota bacterium]